MRLSRDRSFYRRELIAAGLGGLANEGPLAMSHILNAVGSWYGRDGDWKNASLEDRERSRGPIPDESLLPVVDDLFLDDDFPNILDAHNDLSQLGDDQIQLADMFDDSLLDPHSCFDMDHE